MQVKELRNYLHFLDKLLPANMAATMHYFSESAVQVYLARVLFVSALGLAKGMLGKALPLRNRKIMLSATVSALKV